MVVGSWTLGLSELAQKKPFQDAGKSNPNNSNWAMIASPQGAASTKAAEFVDPSLKPKVTAEQVAEVAMPDQAVVAETARAAEQKRRQLIVTQNQMIKTSSLGASIKDQLLGGRVTLAGV